MRSGLARGFTPPRVTMGCRDVALASIAGAKTAREVVFSTPFKTMPASIPANEQETLRDQAPAIIREQVQPAYAKVPAFFRNAYVPKARSTLAAESMPGAKAYYQSKIVEYTTTHLTAEQIHAIGLAEMAKTRAELMDTMKKAGFQGDLPAFLQFLRTDPQFYAKTPQELLTRAAWIAKKFDAVGSVEDSRGRPARTDSVSAAPKSRRTSGPCTKG